MIRIDDERGEKAARAPAGPGKSGACWRAPTEDRGFAGRSTPTMMPAGRENPEHVGVPRRRTKALRRSRRQQGCRRKKSES